MRLAAAFGVAGSDIPTVALAGFLVRGGLALLLLPSVVLPSVVGIESATSVHAFTLSGDPTPWFLAVLVAAGIGLIVWLLLAAFIGSFVDVWLVRAALEVGDNEPGHSLPAAGPGLLVGLVAVRIACLAPLAIALAWAGGRIYTATYAELVTPSNLAVSLPARVVGDAADAVVVVIATWLACETIGALAVRRILLTGVAAWRAIVGALAQSIRRPIWTLLTVVASYGVSAVTSAAAFLATAAAFDWVLMAARTERPIPFSIAIGPVNTTRDVRPVVFLLAVIALMIVWLVALTLSGVASAWRSAAFTHEAAAALGRVPPAQELDERVSRGEPGPGSDAAARSGAD
jgi:hypothetical protein